MRNAQTEEFKHFAMDLEFLLRRTPVWREIAAGNPLPGGDIVERGEEAEEGAGHGGSGGGAQRRLAGHRKHEGGGAVNHLLREHAPITEAAGASSTTRRASGSSRRWRPASSSTSAARTAGTTRPPTSAASSRWTATSRASTARAGACCRSSSCAPTSRVSRAELRDLDRGAEDIDLDALDEAAPQHRASPRTRAVFHGWPRRGIRGIAEACTHDADRARRRLRPLPAPHRRGGRDAPAQRHRRPVRARARPRRSTPA